MASVRLEILADAIQGLRLADRSGSQKATENNYRETGRTLFAGYSIIYILQLTKSELMFVLRLKLSRINFYLITHRLITAWHNVRHNKDHDRHLSFYF